MRVVNDKYKIFLLYKITCTEQFLQNKKSKKRGHKTEQDEEKKNNIKTSKR